MRLIYRKHDDNTDTAITNPSPLLNSNSKNTATKRLPTVPSPLFKKIYKTKNSEELAIKVVLANS